MKLVHRITPSGIVQLIALFLLGSCGESMDLKTVENLDIEKYSGTWYEIARLPNSFERGLTCVTATYTLRDGGKIGVENKGFSAKKSRFKTIQGKARIPDPTVPGWLKVSFFWPFSGNYCVMEIDQDYTYALVGDPSRKYLWVLSRTPKLDSGLYQHLLDKAEQAGFQTVMVEKTPQNCD